MAHPWERTSKSAQAAFKQLETNIDNVAFSWLMGIIVTREQAVEAAGKAMAQFMDDVIRYCADDAPRS